MSGTQKRVLDADIAGNQVRWEGVNQVWKQTASGKECGEDGLLC